ncbi:MAG TPA: hypothetical protein VFV87_03310, partial [Pirellulaceae bacterium]|nr:hypothetical protein [Pirellulaceae bacterium]
MFQRIRPRFSLRSLLLLFTLAAVSVSHYVTSGKLEQIRAERDSQRQTIRDLNDQLGRLTVDDPTQVHAIATFQPWVAPTHYGSDFVQLDGLAWDLHLPAGTEWRLCASFTLIPQIGLPPLQFQRPVKSGVQGDWHLRFSISPSPSRGWTAEFVDGEQTYP